MAEPFVAPGSLFRPAVASPSIERGALFATYLREKVSASVPATMRGQIAVTIQSGNVEPLSVTCFGNDSGDIWPSSFMRRDLRQWLQDRVPSDWWGTVTIRVQLGVALQVVIARSFQQ